MRYLALILLTAVPLLAQGTPEGSSNDTPATATALDIGGQAEGVISAGPAPGIGDEDWFRFTLTTPQDLRAWTGPSLVRPIGDTKLELYVDSGSAAPPNLVLAVDDGSTSTHGFYSLMTLGNVGVGTYYLVVKGYSPTILGGYTLDLVCAGVGRIVPRNPLRPVFSGIEPNDPLFAGGVATASALWTRNEGVLSSGGGGISFGAGNGDYDWFSFSVVTSGAVTLVTGPPSILTTPPVQDTVLHLVDSSFARLAFNDNDGASGYSRLSYNLVPGQIYYAVVSGFSTADAGSYALDIIPSSPAQGSVAAVHVLPPSPINPCPGSAAAISLGVRTDTSNGFNVRTEQPIWGSTFYLDILNAQWPVFCHLGPRLAAGGPQPFASICTRDIDLANAVILTLNPNANPGDPYFWPLSIPLDQVLLGIHFEAQVAGYDPITTFAVSNRCTIDVGLNF